MARYVLEAPDELMEAGKVVARQEGISFAELLRQGLVQRMSRNGVLVVREVPSAVRFEPSSAVLCEARNPDGFGPMGGKCRFPLGHPGEHSWKT